MQSVKILAGRVRYHLFAVRLLYRLDALVRDEQTTAELAPLTQAGLLQLDRFLGLEIGHHQAACVDRAIGKSQGMGDSAEHLATVNPHLLQR